MNDEERDKNMCIGLNTCEEVKEFEDELYKTSHSDICKCNKLESIARYLDKRYDMELVKK